MANSSTPKLDAEKRNFIITQTIDILSMINIFCKFTFNENLYTLLKDEELVQGSQIYIKDIISPYINQYVNEKIIKYKFKIIILIIYTIIIHVILTILLWTKIKQSLTT